MGLCKVWFCFFRVKRRLVFVGLYVLVGLPVALQDRA